MKITTLRKFSLLCALVLFIPFTASAKKAKKNKDSKAKTEVTLENNENAPLENAGDSAPLENADSGQENAVLEETAPENTEESAAEKPLQAEMFKMVTVGKGGFSMGSGRGDSNERPVHWVNIDAFNISTTEVTQKLYTSIMNENPSYFIGDDRPVEKVTWFQAVIFCNKLSEIFGLNPCYTYNGTSDTSAWGQKFDKVQCDFSANGYRLPTEAEWEYAAAEGSKNSSFKYAGSDSVKSVAWMTLNSQQMTHNVATKEPNALGIYDLSGNVEEWCWDWFADSYYSDSPAKNPKGAKLEDGADCRVVRGGSYGSADYEFYGTTRIAERHKMWPNTKAKNIGFRIVQSVTESE